MHPPEVKRAALKLVAAGHNDCEISRRLGVPRRTILDWRRPTYVSRREFEVGICPRCWRAARPMVLTNDDYTELLAMYLGDGCISRGPRTMRLRITLDQKHPQVIEHAAALLRRCFPFNRVGLDTKGVTGKCVNVSVYSRHLPCLLPQHGPGSKHRRRIMLEPWQLRILESSPWPFIRGCIRTDGCCFINRTGPYEYLSYGFTNMSKEIVDLFLGACELVGVHARVSRSRTRGTWQVRVNRRQSVALMLEHVGTKT